MTFEIEVNGRIDVVSVEAIGPAGPAGGRFRVRVRGRRRGHAPDQDVTLVLDARMTDVGVSIAYESDRRVVDAAVTGQARGEVLVQLGHVALTATVDGRRFRGDAVEAVGDGEQRIVAPMPGRVLRVLVKVGDDVAARQGLVVVEAMKMENELVAARAGRVAEVAVSEGASVEAGRLLVRLE